MMPKSTPRCAPSASTNMFPGCRSAWKKPSRNTCLKKAPAALRSRSSDRVAGGDQRVAVVDPDADDALDASARCGRCAASRPAARGSSGRRRNSRPARRRPPPRSADPFRAAPIAPGSRTTSTGFSRRSAGWVRSISRASHRNRSRSRAKARAMPGPQHLDRDLAARRLSRAKCTCAIEAAATGVSSNAANRLRAAARTPPRSARRASLPGNGGSRSCSSRQIRGDLVAEQIGAGRQDLAELDEARARARSARRPAARPGRAGAGRAAGAAGGRRATAAPRRRPGREREQTARRAAPGSAPIRMRRARLRQRAEQLEHGRSRQSRQAGCSAAMPPVRLRKRARSSPAAAISISPARSAAESGGCSRRDRHRRRGCR